MDNGRTGNWHFEHVLTSFFDALLHGETGFLGLAVAETNVAVAVTDDHKCGEGETTSTLYHLGHAVHLDGALFVLGLLLVSH